MRWNGQAIGTSDVNALPGMEHLGGFVRSVTTPEFAGMTFHEVVAAACDSVCIPTPDGLVLGVKR